MGWDEKSEGTVRTESLSTSIRELVEGESVCSISGGAGARFWEGVSLVWRPYGRVWGASRSFVVADSYIPPLLFVWVPWLQLLRTTSLLM
jgi:hypothetical protein